MRDGRVAPHPTRPHRGPPAHVGAAATNTRAREINPRPPQRALARKKKEKVGKKAAAVEERG